MSVDDKIVAYHDIFHIPANKEDEGMRLTMDPVVIRDRFMRELQVRNG